VCARCWRTVDGSLCRYATEPNCLSYELVLDDKDNTKALIYERYATADDLDVAHQKTLGAYVGATPSPISPITKEMRRYTESNVGHMDR
jgi:quinol monooxygenase YgiN